MSAHKIAITVNGKRHEREIPARVHLADFLRHQLQLTGTHIGCEHGVCGACTVLVDGRAVRSCLMLAVEADGAEVTTVEGLAQGEKLSPIQQAFHEHHALQCGFCTPGFLTTLTQLLREHPDASEETIREELSGNLCRCTGYAGIVKAALQAAAAMRDSGANKIVEAVGSER